MYTHSKVVGSRFGATPAPRPDQNPSARRQELDPLRAQRLGSEPENPGGESSKFSGQTPQHTGAYTLITPNETRRSKLQRIAETELKDLETWKEQNRAKPVSLVPTRLGGSQSEAEVRQKQQLQLLQSKYQQKLKREESVRLRKAAEEADIQKMKAIQREKSNKLEERKSLQEKLRRDAFREHHQHKTAEFLSQLDTEFPNRSACPTSPRDPQPSTWSELLDFKRQQEEEERAQSQHTEHRRVNNAFLDRLQGASRPGGLEQSGGYWNMNRGNSWGM
ncbi:epithelial-stromal interaction protein 1 isoform X2 [Tenrec ecaudatus]|uniref:epithelial-stromal interaction protein 1 isoform X2 n=1 Tax=Tenrec ecaudatus TaxID=94439 RepID=UPI003F595647